MNLFEELNIIIEEIEKNLYNKISVDKLAAQMGLNRNVFDNLFVLLINMTPSEYIRKRRLTLSLQDVYKKMKIVDIAEKYQYTNETSFSRAFKKMYGKNPKEVIKDNCTLVGQERVNFTTMEVANVEFEYKLQNKEEMILYGRSQPCEITNVSKVAQPFWSQLKKQYQDFNNYPVYGLLFNDKGSFYYSCCKKSKSKGLKEVKVKAGTYFVMRCKNKISSIKRLNNLIFNRYLKSLNMVHDNCYTLEIYHPNFLEISIRLT